MKNFLLFYGKFYYPHGGWKDFYGSFKSIEEAKVVAEATFPDWYQIVNSLTGIIEVDYEE